MTARSFFVLFLSMVFSGCSLFHSDDPAPAQGAVTTKKKSSLMGLWPLASQGPTDATPYMEYQRVHTEGDKTTFTLFARNTHMTKTIEGDIRTTLETSANESKVDSEHFSLAPNETKKLLVYPAAYHLTYEVSAFFKE